MKVIVRGVVPAHARKPKVHAEVIHADTAYTVLWDPYRGGWRCTGCGNTTEPCPHADAVVDLLHPDVLGASNTAPALACRACGHVLGHRATHRVVGDQVLCIPCTNAPGTHAVLFPDCPSDWHNIYNHEGSNAVGRSAAARVLELAK